jgi:uncharacterized protein (DUF169 family)
MTFTAEDRATLEKLQLEIEPVGIKFLLRQPQDVPRLDKNLTLCEMLKHAQAGNSFYADAQNHTCDAGTYVLGQTEVPIQFLSGEYGAGLGVFSDPRAASRIYTFAPRIAKGTVNYIRLAPLSQMTFDPDVMIFLAKTTQAEILMRATSYKTGKMWSNRYSPVIGCSWLFVYPFVSGEMDFMPTGFGFGMRRRKLFPEGLHFLTFPADQLGSLLQTLREMPLVPRPYQADGLEYVKQLKKDLGIE